MNLGGEHNSGSAHLPITVLITSETALRACKHQTPIQILIRIKKAAAAKKAMTAFLYDLYLCRL